MKKSVILSAAVLLVVGVTWIVYLLSKQLQVATPTQDKTAALFQLSGDGDQAEPGGQTLYQQEMALLKKQLPVEQATFTLTYDYSKEKFYVTLEEPKAESSLAFDAWLASQNISAVPRDKFIFE
jgi:hypothetical protein